MQQFGARLRAWVYEQRLATLHL